MAKLILPGLIDPHVHLRDLGQNEKEDYYSGTCAAIAGGFTTVLDMPNNKTPIINVERLKEKINIAKEKVVCDIGFYFGSLGDNINEFKKVENLVYGLKLYLDETTGNFLIGEEAISHVFSTFSQTLPILVHAENDKVEKVLSVLRKNPRRVHFCHITLKKELELIAKAKEEDLPITCGVTPHHLFLTEKDLFKLGNSGKMKPSLKTREDVDFLWQNLRLIDVIESDHAPHTIEEKKSEKYPYGVPGLETTLPLLLTAVSQDKLTIEEIIRLCHDNPAKIFGIKQDSKIEVDTEATYEIKNEELFTKCKWSPFNGWKVKGKVKKVSIRGTQVFEDGKILVEPGFGKVLKHNV